MKAFNDTDVLLLLTQKVIFLKLLLEIYLT